MTTQTSTLNKKFSLGEEIANAITHGIGFGLSIAALVVLIVQAAQHGTAWHVVSYTIFGATLIMLYLASTLHHSIPTTRQVFFRIDQAAIFLLDCRHVHALHAGHACAARWGWTLFGIVWGLAVFGVVFKSVFGAKYEKVGTGHLPADGLAVHHRPQTLHRQRLHAHPDRPADRRAVLYCWRGILFTCGTGSNSTI